MIQFSKTSSWIKLTAFKKERSDGIKFRFTRVSTKSVQCLDHGTIECPCLPILAVVLREGFRRCLQDLKRLFSGGQAIPNPQD